MVKALSVLVATAIAACALAPISAHEGLTTRALSTEERRLFAQSSQSALTTCTATASSRKLQERAAIRRAETVAKLREEHRQRRLDAATALAKDHKSTTTGITADTKSSTLFTSNTYIVEPEVTEGPYYVKGEYIRSDMRETQSGVKMVVDVQVIDVNTCQPVEDILCSDAHGATGNFVKEKSERRPPLDQPPPIAFESVEGAVVVVADVSVVADEVGSAVVGAVVVEVEVELSVVEEEVVEVVVVSVVDELAEDVVAEDVVESADEVVDEAADEVVEADVAHTVAVVGSVVKAVTVKSGVPPWAQVQQGSPKAAPLVMSELGKVSAQKAAVQESPTASKAVAKSVYCELSLSGCPSSCEKRDPLGM
ncbi:hypothetical protein PRNP1_011566 [Phytophthora ramorum]